MPLFTIMMPVHRDPELMKIAVKTVENQNIQDYELFIICDGAPESIAVAARELAALDQRVTALVHDKGERNGEAHRNLALKQASGKFVCQIADDDLWFPNHLEEVQKLLESNDFGCTLRLALRPNSPSLVSLFDLGVTSQQNKLLRTNRNFLGLTNSAYRLSAYNMIPDGWSPAPRTMPSDLFMWRKFLTIPKVRVATRFVMTAIVLEAPWRLDWNMAERVEEMEQTLILTQDTSATDPIIQQGMRSGVEECLQEDPSLFDGSIYETSLDQEITPDAKLIKGIMNFDAKGYLEKHPDVKKHGINPYEHFIRYGLKEGRTF